MKRLLVCIVILTAWTAKAQWKPVAVNTNTGEINVDLVSYLDGTVTFPVDYGVTPGIVRPSSLKASDISVWYSFSDAYTNGNIVLDDSGNNAYGLVGPSSARFPVVTNCSARFLRANEGYLHCSNDVFDSETQFTIAFWGKTSTGDGNLTNTYPVIFAGPDNQNQADLQGAPGIYGDGTNTSVFIEGTGVAGSGDGDTLSSTNLRLDDWTHWAVTYKKSGEAGGAAESVGAVYSNGIRVAHDATMTNLFQDEFTDQWYIGGIPKQTTSNLFSHASCAMWLDDVILADVAWSSNTIYNLAQEWRSLALTHTLLTNCSIGNITTNSATATATMASDEKQYVWLYYGQNSGGTTNSAWANTNNMGLWIQETDGTVSNNLSGLDTNSTYFIRFWSTNQYGSGWSAETNFDTL